jgi:hypothetical protein
LASAQAAYRHHRPTWHDPRVLFILFLVFLCGVAAGIVGMKLRPAAPTKLSAWFAKEGKGVTLNRLRKELNLTERQSRDIESALDDFGKYYQSLQVQMDEVRANGKERILGVLNADQRVKFEQMLGDMQGKSH